MFSAIRVAVCVSRLLPLVAPLQDAARPGEARAATTLHAIVSVDEVIGNRAAAGITIIIVNSGDRDLHVSTDSLRKTSGFLIFKDGRNVSEDIEIGRPEGNPLEESIIIPSGGIRKESFALFDLAPGEYD